MPTFDALDADAQALVLANANPLDLASMTAVTNTVDAIESLNDVIRGDDDSITIADAIADLRATMEAPDGAPADTLVLGNNSTVPNTILGGAGLGLVVEAGEEPSHVDLGVTQRSDELFAAMSPTQIADVQAKIEELGASDIVGALSAMGVFDMNAVDPTVTNFMPTFNALDADAQALVLANANPLDLASMTAVTNAVDAIESLNDVISGVDTTTSIADAISDVRDMMEDAVLGSNATPAAGTILGGAGLGLVVEAGEEPSHVNLGVSQRSDDLFAAMSPEQVAAVQQQIVDSPATDIVGALSAMGVFDMGGPGELTDPTLTNFMPTFDALDADAQALVLANANPLDLASMTAVTN
ncbi:MAG: hypothetical protein VXY65_04480, partial [Actinomycetota bacterium]|nr:hypothetical protein [Actinomycetota bacterium]